MKKLAIIGAAELGSLVMYFASQTGEYGTVGFFDDNSTKGSIFHDRPILGAVKDIKKQYELGIFTHLFIGIGYNHMRRRHSLYNMFKGVIPFATIIHKTAYVDPSSVVGEGVILFPGCVVDMKVVIGNNVLLNTSVSVSHHSDISDNCFLSPRVAIAGRTSIGKNCFIGMGATVTDMVVVGSDCMIGARSLVRNNIAEGHLVFGTPAKIIRKLKNEG